MKMKSLKFEWSQLNRRGKLLLAGGAAVVFLGLALSTGIGAADPPAADSKPAAAVSNAKVEMTENAESYVVSIDAPRDQQSRMTIRMDGNSLLIGSSATPGGVRFEQSLRLPDADTSKTPTFDQQGNRLVVTVPKGTPRKNAAPTIGPSPSLLTSSAESWMQHVMGQFQQMQRRMDQMMHHAMSNFGQADPFADFSSFASMPGLTGVNIEDEGNEYVVRASLPGEALENVEVTVDNERVLKITAKNESSGANRYHSSNFTQVVTLPGPVQSDKMQLDQKDGGLLIKLPKA